MVSKKIINYGSQFIDDMDVEQVSKALVSSYLTQGPIVDLFESNLKSFFKSKYAIALSSGTSALHIGIKSLKLKKDSSVITTPLTFISTASSILMNGLRPIFSDIEKTSLTLDPNKVEDQIKKNSKIKAIIAVDFAGHPCEWEAFYFLKKKYNLKLINDNCHALGSKLLNNIGYAAKYADIVTHSYHPVKNFTTGEGGAILTNNKKLYEYALLQRSHGIDKGKKSKKIGMWHYEVKEYGFNYRITDIQSSLGLSQLKKLKKFIIQRRKIASIYDSIFSSKSEYFDLPPIKDKRIFHSYHLYPLQVDFKKLKINKKKFFEKLLKQNIRLQVHYVPLYKQPFLKKFINNNSFPITEKYYQRAVSLPIFYDLDIEIQKKICKKIFKELNLNF